MKVELKLGSVLEATTDAIVDATDNAGAVGEASATPVAGLPYRAIIHAPTMVHPAEPIPPKQIELATVAALRCADEGGFSSLALPALGTGVGDVDFDTAAKIMMETIQLFRGDNTLKFVQVWLSSPESYQAFTKHSDIL